jgi:mono/diheme cytochrome c family protein
MAMKLRSRAGALGALFLTGSLFAGCGGGAEAPSAEQTTGGEAAPSYEGPVASTDVEAGRAQFEQHCNGCHPGGAQGYGPAIASIEWDPAQMRRQIREGSGRMPGTPADALSSADLESLLAYLQTLGSVSASPEPL